jgi:hypothetical protein
VVPKHLIMSSTDGLCTDWKLIAYLMRIGQISLDCDINVQNEFIITDRNHKQVLGFKEIKLDRYTLYQSE